MSDISEVQFSLFGRGKETLTGLSLDEVIARMEIGHEVYAIYRGLAVAKIEMEKPVTPRYLFRLQMNGCHIQRRNLDFASDRLLGDYLVTFVMQNAEALDRAPLPAYIYPSSRRVHKALIAALDGPDIALAPDVDGGEDTDESIYLLVSGVPTVHVQSGPYGTLLNRSGFLDPSNLGSFYLETLVECEDESDAGLADFAATSIRAARREALAFQEPGPETPKP